MRLKYVLVVAVLMITAAAPDVRALPAVALQASAVCNGNDLVVSITAGDGPFDLGGSGPGLPKTSVGSTLTILTGPGIWTGVTVTEQNGNRESTTLGDFTCQTSLKASAMCNGNELVVSITAGDGPFDLGGSGPGLPKTSVGSTLTILTGPGIWTGVTVTEQNGNRESTTLGDFTCQTSLKASAVCNGNDLVVSITAGDGPFDLGGSGPGLPKTSVGSTLTILTGPGIWTGVTVTEQNGNRESTTLGDFTCQTSLKASAMCNGNELVVSITAGDGPFDLGGSGPGLPKTSVGSTLTILTGPGIWTGVTVTEQNGNRESTPLGTFGCGLSLQASAVCTGARLDVTISSGDAPFDITGSGPGLPLTSVEPGLHPLAGPGTWTALSVTEKNGDRERATLGDFMCLSGIGAECTAANLCQSGFCAQGVCCDQACDEPGHYCNLPGRQGTCTVPVAPAPALTPVALLLVVGVLALVGCATLRRQRGAIGESRS